MYVRYAVCVTRRHQAAPRWQVPAAVGWLGGASLPGVLPRAALHASRLLKRPEPARWPRSGGRAACGGGAGAARRTRACRVRVPPAPPQKDELAGGRVGWCGRTWNIYLPSSSASREGLAGLLLLQPGGSPDNEVHHQRPAPVHKAVVRGLYVVEVVGPVVRQPPGGVALGGAAKHVGDLGAASARRQGRQVGPAGRGWGGSGVGEGGR